MKFFTKKYDQTVVVEFFSDKSTTESVIKENSKNLLGSLFKEENRLFYSSLLESYPDLSQLTSQSRLCLIGHSAQGKQKFSGCDVDMLVERLVEDCSLSAVKRITFIACYLGEAKAFIEELQLKLANEGIYTEIAAYKAYLVIDSSGHRWVDLGEKDGLVEAGKQKIVMGWENGPQGTPPKQVVLVDTDEINPHYVDELSEEGEEDAEIIPSQVDDLEHMSLKRNLSLFKQEVIVTPSLKKTFVSSYKKGF
ncbi:C80 family cysteine peptidase [Fluoribacter gormanii]|uniref:Peptidase C80 family n=1 Tax=Fluoribacter gormanii TaxID=464 RepID=A0A377GHC9_9GAMM|nr:C80 family cysteine peptidase [Fluoribacter gormanii]KTD02137.1 Peptidase C80 family protein [Fluoribacter gormanii]MCW8444322.1 C80 family cysteine peptidase [Fluoribacter gormanii]MCW8469513.1 C80 family cysteine peptidase [Fluoribacter gormanii]SIR51007.1 Peptidase C80 family protein [Fluoribacter gormanii]STO24158.1 Peptidase C80 family [Fluoribacter gormanii]